MPTIEEGQTAEFTVPAGQQVTVTTAGRARIHRREGLPNSGQFAAQVVTGEAVFSGLNLATDYRIEAVSGDVDYQIAWPLVRDLPFRRNAAGAIDAVMDGDTAVPLGGGDSEPVSWGDVQGKPSTFPPSAHTHTAAQVSDATAVGRSVLTAADAAAARAAIGAGTSNLAIGTTAGTAAAGSHTHPELADLEARVAALEAAAG